MSHRHIFGWAAACLLAAGLPLTSSPWQGAQAAIPSPRPVPAVVETVPVANSGDAADDAAIWVHPTDPASSLVIGNDKKGALEVYNLDGSRQQRITTGTRYWANVDVRQGVRVAGRDHDVVAVLNGGLRLYTVHPGSRTLTSITDGDGVVPIGWADGLCMYDSAASGNVSVFAVTVKGRVRQYVLTDADQDGLLLANLVREFQVVAGTPPPEAAEGCVADDANGALYVSEEEVGLWRYGAEPGDGAARTPVDTVQPGGNLAADVEGLTIVDRGQGAGYLVASAQNVAAGSQNYYAVYDRRTNVYLESVRIVAGTTADGCQRTDGIAAYAGYLGPAFPQGLFVCQDNSNTAPGSTGNQNFKFTPLEHVVDLGTGPPPPGPVELLSNRSVEADGTGYLGVWSANDQVTWSAETGRDGTHSIRIRNTATTAQQAGLNTKPVAVPSTTAGDGFIASVWVRATIPNQAVSLRLRECDSTGACSIGSATRTATLADSNWHQLQVSYQARGSGNQLRYHLTAEKLAPTTSVYADLFSLTKQAAG